MKWELDKKILDNMSLEELELLENHLWTERKKVIAIIEYKKVMGK